MVNTISKAAHKVGGKVRKSKKVAKSIKGKKGRTSMRKTMKKKRGGISSGPYKLNLMKSLGLKSKTGVTKMKELDTEIENFQKYILELLDDEIYKKWWKNKFVLHLGSEYQTDKCTKSSLFQKRNVNEVFFKYKNVFFC